MATTIAASLEGADFGVNRQSEMARANDNSQHNFPFRTSAEGVVVNYEKENKVDAPPTLGSKKEPTPEQIKQAAEPEPTYIPTEQAPTDGAGSAEGTICSIWVALPCGYILAVARCESGPDYYVGSGAGYYIGTFQLDPELHGWRFRQHGWDIGTDGTDIYKNSVVAYELYKEQGMSPWPVCRYV